MPDSTGALPRRPRRAATSGKPKPRAAAPAPAICHAGSAPSAAQVARAAALGFNTLGIGAAADVAAAAGPAAAAGLALMVDLDSGATDAEVAALQALGVTGFRCLDAAAQPDFWAAMIVSAKSRDESSRFFAWTAGAAPAAMARLRHFDYGFSSLCWWDFSAPWLDGDAARVARIGPAVAPVAAPGAAWPPGAAARRRALTLAAIYGAGWLMPLGYETGSETGEPFDLAAEVAALNALRARQPGLRSPASARLVSSAGAAVALLLRDKNLLLSVNPSLTAPAAVATEYFLPWLGGAGSRLREIEGAGPPLGAGAALALPPGGARLWEVMPEPPIAKAKPLPPDCGAPRIAIEDVAPQVTGGAFPVRRVVGEMFEVSASIITDGHDRLAAEILWRPTDETKWRAAPMAALGNDEWRGRFALERLGRHVFAVAAWRDEYATFVDDLTKKLAAGVPTHLEIQEGVLLLRAAGITPDATGEAALRAELLSAAMLARMRAAAPKKFLVKSPPAIVDAERIGARFANWYEIFPRSQSGDATRHGTFRDVIAGLPRIAGMGFDVLYFPPIHPIGRRNRKGRNNTLTPAADDPGSPYAIGAAEGGHDAIHPELGTLDDFHALRDAAAALGIELALDFAIQCAPDHPWIKSHPEWFDWRPDGSLRYAENPPKKYEDITNVDFYAPGAQPALWAALRDVVQFWVDQGVRLFRVDNPHTKPLPFWEWMIADIRGRHPDVVFLAEAFTRPKLMYRLAKIGFSQSYTYFTWRTAKAELEAYLIELTTTAPREFFRPHFFVNTPDINPLYLHNSGRAGFLIRAALAATLSGLWGVYNGFELCEATPVAPGREEYLDSEKYQLRAWDYDRPGNITAEITRLNQIRRANAALQTHLGIAFHNASDDQVLYFSKTAPDGNVVLVAISLDAADPHTAAIEIPLWLFGLPDTGAMQAEDLMRDFTFIWYGKNQSVTLTPESPFCIWRIAPVAT
jgi:starch synthase (maltosyl-transferring)